VRMLLLEDVMGAANVVIVPDVFERDRIVVTRSKFLLVEGSLKNQDATFM
jgi:error-prone DNA polymerase